MRCIREIWVALLVATLGCGGGIGGAATVDSTVLFDANASVDIANDADSDGLEGTEPDVPSPNDVGADIASPDIAANCPGGSGCPCASQTACDSGLCLETSSGPRCAQLCSAGCPSGFRCTAVPQGSDIVQACVAIDARMCTPCLENSACNPPGITDARCVPMGEAGAFCGIGCQTAADCPSGSACQAIKDISGAASKQCVPVDANGTAAACACSVNALALGGSTTCSKSLTADGKSFTCSGKATCVAAGQSAVCEANEPTPESCNGKDDDCDGQTDEGSCDDNNACTQDKCESSAAKCSHANLTGSCDADGNACTQGDSCVGGACVPGAAIDCDDKNPCTKDGCDMAKGCTQVADDSKPCSDDNPCTVGDTCAAGVCESGPPKKCTSVDPCQLAKCDQNTGSCTYKPLPADSDCDDGSACTQADNCASGDCTGKLISCDDANPCTVDACDKAKGCIATPNTAPCNDNNACTIGDSCSGGACTGLALTATQECDDKNPCTTDICDPKDGCVHPAQSAPCDDGNPCTTGDVCDKGLCFAGANSCDCQSDADCAAKDDADLCNGTLACVKNTCAIKANSVVVCTGGSACAPLQCQAATGQCLGKNLADGSSCDADGDPCTQNDACAGGSCVAGPLASCDDGNPCTSDSCSKAQGCGNTWNSLPCTDGNACTSGDTCKAGTCHPGANQCECQQASDCAAKEDGDLCNGTLQCDAASHTCQLDAKTVVVCPASGVACKTAVCSAATGQCSLGAGKDGTSCSDGDACSVGDACLGGACQAGMAASCDDKNPCTKDSCDAKSGCVFVPDPSVTLACYSGPPGTQGVGTCAAGTQACDSKGQLAACIGAIIPAAAEACDGKDDSCNGQTDEGCGAKGWDVVITPVSYAAKGGQTSVSAAGGTAWLGSAGNDINTVLWAVADWLKLSWQ